jgi:Ribonuclease toxin, BrnT, of type II toxin-antitoxin system
MAFTFEWDPRKAVANQRKHGVSFDEAATAFADPYGLVVDDPRTHSVRSAWRCSATPSPDASLRSCSPSAVTAFVSSALGKRLVASIANMKKPAKRAPRVDPDEILPEYDFSKGRRNLYAARMVAGSHIIVLEPDVAAVFPDAAAVNGALRALAGIIRERRPKASRPRRRSSRGSA